MLKKKAQHVDEAQDGL